MTAILPHWQVHDGDGPYLLLVHGFLSGSSQWLPNLQALGAVCRPVTLNLYGHAGSPSPAAAQAYHPDAYVTVFDQIREQLGAERWCLLGYSLGAGLTIRYTLQHPQRVICHLFTNSTSAFADAELTRQWLGTAAATAADIRARGAAALNRIPVHPRHAWRLPAEIRAALLREAELHDPDGIAHTLEVTNPAATVRAMVVDNTRPACLLHGVREKRFTPHRDYAGKAMPELEIVAIDAGHGLNMEAPGAFNEAATDFIRRCST